MTNGYIEMMKAEGWRVFLRKDSITGRNAEWCHVTDGTNIAYVQWRDRVSVSTVHKPNRTTGTGFNVSDSITPAAIRHALYMVAPNWATATDIESVKKWKNWEEFHQADSWNSELFEV